MEAAVAQLLRDRDPAALRAWVPQCQPRGYAKGEVLLHQGSVWEQAFFVERGLLRLHSLGADGKDFSKSFWPERTMVLPLTAAQEDQPAAFNITALEDSVVWLVPARDLRAGLARRGLWEPLRAELLAMLLCRKSQREQDLLALDGTARYLKLCDEEPALVARVPLLHLASYLGLTDVSLSRIRRQLKDQNRPD